MAEGPRLRMHPLTAVIQSGLAAFIVSIIFFLGLREQTIREVVRDVGATDGRVSLIERKVIVSEAEQESMKARLTLLEEVVKQLPPMALQLGRIETSLGDFRREFDKHERDTSLRRAAP